MVVVGVVVGGGGGAGCGWRVGTAPFRARFPSLQRSLLTFKHRSIDRALFGSMVDVRCSMFDVRCSMFKGSLFDVPWFNGSMFGGVRWCSVVFGVVGVADTVGVVGVVNLMWLLAIVVVVVRCRSMQSVWWFVDGLWTP